MRMAMMQPYLFPYISYFQLIQSADLFVAGDDVQFIKQGWINRNRILYEGKDRLFSFSLVKGSYRSNINERTYANLFHEETKRFVKLLEHAYKLAPYKNETITMIKQAMDSNEMNVAFKNTEVIKHVCEYIGITTPIVVSSEITKPYPITKEERILFTLKHFGSNCYINPVGGANIYSKEYFRDQGVELLLLQPKPVVYKQLDQPFVPWLSIIDVLMFNPLERVSSFLKEYEFK